MDSDPLPMWFNIGLVFFLVFLNGFFVAAEFAIVKVRNTRIETLIQAGNHKAKIARNIVANLNAYLSATQLGITLASLGLGWVGEPAVADMIRPLLALMGLGTSEAILHTLSFVIAFSLITALHIILGELAPKSMAIQQSEAIALWAARPLHLFYVIMFPFIWILNEAANLFLRLLGFKPETDHQSAHTEEEIRLLMKESHESGFIDNTELTLVDNIFEFSETHAREIMIPRTEMVCLYTENSYEENREITFKEMHTRYPLCDPDKDHIIGFIHIKDLWKNDQVKDIRRLVRPITKVPDSIQISKLLKIMQKKKTEMCILIDEYGGTSGLVTLEDILEEIVGEIQDEFDEERPPVEKKGEETWSIDGRLLIDEVNEQFHLKIECEDYDTIGGWVYSQVEIPPRKGQRVLYDQRAEFIIEEMDQLRISRLTVHLLSPTEDTLVDEAAAG
ncbi:conserved membrane hypothetical protein [[Clostridium] ultunense Esp]|nr:conserved membrane hypothetical protein [[Clostridium] ultunense Esp]